MASDDTKSSYTDILNSYIKSLIENVDHSNIPSEIDVVFDGGAFNGIIEQGIAMYLQIMENTGKLKVRRVSGCSIGAFVALVYVSNKLFDFEDSFTRVARRLKDKHDLLECAHSARRFIFEQLSDTDIEGLNDVLHITYYDMELSQQIVVQRFDSREHLYECIMRSTHLPFLSNSEMKYKGRYVDGLTPHIFRDGKRNVLFVSTLTRKKISRVLMNSNESNCSSRLIAGVADADEFFSRGSSDLCSWVNDWSFYHFYFMRIREFVCFFIIWTLNALVIIPYNLPSSIKQSYVYHGLVKCCAGIYSDVLYCLIKI